MLRSPLTSPGEVVRRSGRRRWPRIVALVAFLLPACAPLLDWSDLTAGVDASTADASHDRAVPDAAPDARADACPDAFPANPCALVNCDLCNGYYCGRSMQNGFAGGDPSSLYECVDGSTLDVQRCETGCIISTSTLADCCDHCTGLADGTYCGSTLGYTGGYNGAFAALRNVIFSCRGGVYAGSETACAPKSCVQNGSVATCQ